jgi:hypothetical protein
MKFIEVTIKLRKILNEMSDSRSDAIFSLKALSKPYTKHICKILLWGKQNQEWTQDWSTEVYNYIKQVHDITLKGGKKLKQRDYFQYFFYKNLEAKWELEERLNQVSDEFIQRDGHPNPNYVNLEKAYDNYKLFVDKIYSLMSNKSLNYLEVISLCKEYLL